MGTSTTGVVGRLEVGRRWLVGSLGSDRWEVEGMTGKDRGRSTWAWKLRKSGDDR